MRFLARSLFRSLLRFPARAVCAALAITAGTAGGVLSGVHAPTAMAAAPVDGYPLANFALTVNAGADGAFFGEILRNPGKLGRWLENQGAVRFYVEKDGKRHEFSGFSTKKIERACPFVTGDYAGSPLTGATFKTTAFCPVKINDTATTALPAVLLEIKITAGAKAERFDIVVEPRLRDKKFKDAVLVPKKRTPEPTLSAIVYEPANAPDAGTAAEAAEKNSAEKNAFNKFAIGLDRTTGTGTTAAGAPEFRVNTARDAALVPVHLDAGETRTLRFAVYFHDKTWAPLPAQFLKTLPDPTDAVAVLAAVFKNFDTLRAATGAFSNALPATGDVALNRALRWYVTPALSLTKCTADGKILTMGYRELNQRDSFWTSWLHLVLFKDAERVMLDESIAAQRADGKIPTTILPLIERNDDLDINGFFILRAARFHDYWRDHDSLRTGTAEWLALKRATDWLISRCTDGVPLPAQRSFWGDWKDVGGVKSRKYSPFTAFVYLAALKKMNALATILGDNDAAKKYADAYAAGSAQANKDTAAGGLWNGEFYCQRDKDGTVRPHLLQDQTIGILYGVIPPDRAASIIAALNRQSLTPYGIAETTPYYPASFGYAPGTYHNGAVWPWLSFMDCWARAKTGRKAEAIDLVKRVAKADLEDSGDWSPNEHINSRTGANLGFHIQGWNAGIYGLVKFGILDDKDTQGGEMP